MIVNAVIQVHFKSLNTAQYILHKPTLKFCLSLDTKEWDYRVRSAYVSYYLIMPCVASDRCHIALWKLILIFCRYKHSANSFAYLKRRTLCQPLSSIAVSYIIPLEWTVYRRGGARCKVFNCSKWTCKLFNTLETIYKELVFPNIRAKNEYFGGFPQHTGGSVFFF